MLISPGTDPLRTHFVTRLYEWVHIDEVTASPGAHWPREHELAKEKVVSRVHLGDYAVINAANPAVVCCSKEKYYESRFRNSHISS
jgi:hypothetical protein